MAMTNDLKNSEKILIDKCLLSFLESTTKISSKEILGTLFYLSEEQVTEMRKSNKGNDQNTTCSRRKIRFPETDIDLAFKSKKRFGILETEVYIWKSRALSFLRTDIENMVVEDILLGDDCGR
jgi:hypothetical protein